MAGPTGAEPNDTVSLNGVTFPIIGPVRRSETTPFASKIASGDTKRSDSTLASYRVYEDFRGGGSLLYAREDKPGRYWHSTLDSRYPRQVVLTPRSTFDTTDDFQPVTRGFIDFNSATYALGNLGGIFKTSGGASPSWSTQDSGTTYNFIILYGSPSGIPAMYAFQAAGTTYKHSTDGTTWTSKTGPSNCFMGVVYDGKLFVVNSTASGVAIHYSSNPDAGSPTWDDTGIRVPGGASGIGLYVDPQGEEAIVLASPNSLYRFNFFERTLTLLADGIPASPTANGYELPVHNGMLMVPTKKGVFQYTYSTSTFIGPQKDDGFDASYRGEILSLQSEGGLLWAHVVHLTNINSLMVWDGFGWHRIWQTRDTSTRAPANWTSQASFLVSNISTGNGETKRVWFGGREGGATVHIGYFDIPAYVDNPLQVSAMVYENDGLLETSWDDFNFAHIPKGVYEIIVDYRLQDADNSILIEYATDDSTSYNAETFTITGSSDLAETLKTLKLGSSDEGIECVNFRIRVTLTRDSGTNTTTPVLKALTVKYIPRPPAKRSWQFVVDLREESLAAWGLNFLTAMAAIEAARDSVPLLDFQPYPPLSEARRVLVVNSPDDTTWVNARREGQVTIVVAEPV